MTQATKQFQTQTQDGATLNVYLDGRGPALFLLSGLGGTAGFWAPLVATLSSQFTILRFDQRGIAGSTRGTLPCTIQTLADDALHVLKAAEITQATVLGHSTGGCIVQSMALQNAAVIQRAILSATWIRAGAYMKALFELRKNLLSLEPRAYAETAALLSYPPAWLETHWSVYEKARANTPQTADDVTIIRERIDALLAHDGHQCLSAMRMPTLILGADDDMIVPAFHQQELAQSLSGSQIAMLPRGGHFFPITETASFIEIVTRFMNEAQ